MTYKENNDSEEENDLYEDHEPRDVSRTGIALQTFLQVGFLFLILLLLNYLNYRHFKSWDTSSEKQFTLSETSQNILNAIESPIEMITCFTRGSSITTEISALAEQYQQNSNGNIILKQFDPVRDANFYEEIKNKHQISLKENSILLINKDQTKVIEESELFFKDPERIKNDNAITFHGEDTITSSLLSLTEDEKKQIYIIGDQSSIQTSKYGSLLNVMADFARKHNAEARVLNLTEAGKIPENADCILLVNPKYDLPYTTIDEIQTYWEEDQGSLLFLLNPDNNTPRLDKFLAMNGVSRINNRVMYVESTALGITKQYGVEANVLGSTPIAKRLPAHVVSLPGQSNSLKLDSSNPRLKDSNIEVLPLLSATSRYWGETNYLDKLPQVDSADQKAPLYMAASIEYGAVNDARLRVDSSRMIVLGNSEIINPEKTVPANIDFISASLNWLLDRDEMIGIPPKVKTLHRLQITSKQSRNIFQIIAIAFPGAVLTFGLFLWSIRRS